MRWCFGLVIGAAAASAAFGWQADPKPLPPGVTESTVFHVFFLSVAAQEKIADKQKAAGQRDLPTRGGLRRRAHLTNREDDLVKQVARSCNESYDADAQNGFAQVKQLRQQYPPEAGKPRPVEVEQQLASLQQRREDLVQGCMLDLKRGMGEMRFQILRDYAMRNIGQQIKHSDVNPVAQGPAPSKSFPALRTSPSTSSYDNISITDPHPLARVANTLTARYGVPVSYEEGSGYAYAGDLSEPTQFRIEHPDAKSLPPRTGKLNFVNPPFPVAFDPVYAPKPAQLDSVKGFLQSILDQYASNDSPGRFKLVEHLSGLVIVPDQTKDSLGNFVADHSILDLRISFPEVKGGFSTALATFCAALSSAAGKQVKLLTIGMSKDFSIRADNEVARDVLARLLALGSLNHIGIGSGDGRPPRALKSVWTLIAEQSLDPPYTVSYGLSFRNVILERQDKHGNVVGSVAIPVE